MTDNVQEIYQEAYNLHYKHKQPEDSYFYYCYILKFFPDSKEAKYSLQQIDNLQKSNVITSELKKAVSDELEKPREQIKTIRTHKKEVKKK
jgi:hypothetical protein